MELGIASFAAITAIAYLIGYIWKTADKLDDRWIPVICGVSGCALGIIAFIINVPDFPANDIITAAAVGVVSGFAATGINQIYKQLIETNDENGNPDSTNNIDSSIQELPSSPVETQESNKSN